MGPCCIEAIFVAAAPNGTFVSYVVTGPSYGATGEAMAAATEPGFTPNHLYRLLKAYETDPRTRSLLPKALLPAGGFAAVGPAFSRLSSGSGDFQALR